MTVEQICQNNNWTYYNRDGSSIKDASIKVTCPKGTVVFIVEHDLLHGLISQN